MKGFIRKASVVMTILLVLVAVMSFVMYFFLDASTDDDISIKYSSQGQFTISNKLPMPDAVGKNISAKNHKEGNTGYLEFEISSLVDKKVNYEIYLTEVGSDSLVPPKFVKVYFTDEKDRPIKGFDKTVPTYYDLNLSKNDPNGRLLYSGTLKNKEKGKFIVRMWVADTYELTSDVREFSVKLNVKVK